MEEQTNTTKRKTKEDKEKEALEKAKKKRLEAKTMAFNIFSRGALQCIDLAFRGRDLSSMTDEEVRNLKRMALKQWLDTSFDSALMFQEEYEKKKGMFTA